MTENNVPRIPIYSAQSDTWRQALRRYLTFATTAHLFWEFAHLPLYTIWRTASESEIIFAALHCTGGDVLISLTTLVAALLLAGEGWPMVPRTYRCVRVITILLGVGYTIFSEWLNTEVRQAWAYSELMPVIPWIDIGMSPLAQWIIIPLGGFWWARHSFVKRE